MLIFNNGTKTFSLLHSLIFLLISPVVILRASPGLIDSSDQAPIALPIIDVGVENSASGPVSDPASGPVSGPVQDQNDPDSVPEPHPIL